MIGFGLKIIFVQSGKNVKNTGKVREFLKKVGTLLNYFYTEMEKGLLFTYKTAVSPYTGTPAGLPQHRENREFESPFFQTGKTEGIC